MACLILVVQSDAGGGSHSAQLQENQGKCGLCLPGIPPFLICKMG